MTGHFRRMARYNRWANARLYEACTRLPEHDYMRPRPAFFGSIHGTLSHVLVGDRLWLSRIERLPPPHTRLDEQPWPDLGALRSAREAEDARIVALTEHWTAADLEDVVRYRTTSGVEHADRLADVLAHFFNHQTHHRGQVHDQLSQTEIAPPSLDLIFYMREVVA
jgi:uncharacterized damage-inducible protein DinB